MTFTEYVDTDSGVTDHQTGRVDGRWLRWFTPAPLSFPFKNCELDFSKWKLGVPVQVHCLFLMIFDLFIGRSYLYIVRYV